MFSDILLTVDYDRTLTAPDSTIPERNLQATRYFMENGGAFTVNTGRSLPMTVAFRDIVPRRCFCTSVRLPMIWKKRSSASAIRSNCPWSRPSGK